MMKEITNFTISYDAENSEYTEHTIDALQLSESIKAIVNMVSQADKILNGEHSTISVNVNAPAQQGSLEIGYEAIRLLPGAVDVLKVLGLSAIGAALAGGSVLEVIRHLKSEKIIEIVEDKNTGLSKLTTKNIDLAVDPRLAKLAVDPVVRAAMNTLIDKPFEGKQGAKFTIYDKDRNSIMAIIGDETNDYTPLPKGSLIERNVEEIDANIRFTQVNFDGVNGWRMQYKGDVSAVRMEDEGFVKKVQESQTKFSKEDMFAVKLSIAQTNSPRGLNTSYKILKVTRHRVSADKKLI